MATTDILYMPALHQGYINYLGQRHGQVGILNEALVRELPYLDRDIRAIGSQMMRDIVHTVFPDREVFVVSPEMAAEFIDGLEHVVMPDEDVSHVFADEHLRGVRVDFESVFLRWDRQVSTVENIIPPDRIISTNEIDRHFMQVTDTIAQKSPDWWRQLGALLVIDGEQVLLTHNHPFPTKDYTLDTFGDPRSSFMAGEHIELQKNIHAEADLIGQAAKLGIKVEGGSLYVRTFPCPPCARLIATAGIKKVFYRNGYSLLDAEEILKQQGIEIILVQD